MRLSLKSLGVALPVIAFAFSFLHANWEEDGIPLAGQMLSNVSEGTIAPDGSSGVIIAYSAKRGGIQSLIVQRINPGGDLLWGEYGIFLSQGTNPYNPQIVTDGAGGAIVVWEDYRHGQKDIYAQRVDASGAVQWWYLGIAICEAAQTQFKHRITSDGAGGAIIVWQDSRNVDYDIYAQRVNDTGEVQWATDGIVICAEAGDQVLPHIIGDGAGGALISWDDERGVDNDVYAQRINSTGIVQWIPGGAPICTEDNHQYHSQIASDGAGGAIITWMDYRSVQDIYAQKIDGSGSVCWQPNGILVSADAIYNQDPKIVSDGEGGAIISWADSRDDVYMDIYAQRVAGSGALRWTSAGAAICIASGFQRDIEMVADDTGGAFIAWRDYRNLNYDIYAQHVDSLGIVQWAPNGVELCTHSAHQIFSRIIFDGAEGAIAVWLDERSENAEIYTQRANGSGAIQWALDGIPVYSYLDYKDPQIAPDGAGGAIVVCSHYRGSNLDIHAQRVDDSGILQWTVDGVDLCNAAGNQQYPQLAADGAGGAIVVWKDRRNGGNDDIYSQRVDVTGNVLWIDNGIAICTAIEDQFGFQLISDDAGGAIVVWEDERDDSGDIYAQRVNNNGTAEWTSDGIAILAASGLQRNPRIVSDGGGGAIIIWEAYSSGDYTIYAQRVNSFGIKQWTEDGIRICTATGSQVEAQLIPDGAGGAIVVWRDRRSGNYDICVQLVNGSGAVQWTAEGVVLCADTGNQMNPRIASDGAGGAFVTWLDYRNGEWDIYGQRINNTGMAEWSENGVAICAAIGDQWDLRITSYGADDAIIIWEDLRNGNYDIFSQRVNGSGILQWTDTKAALCTVEGGQVDPQIISDGTGGAIVVWEDHRNMSMIYAQRLSHGGVITATTLKQYSAFLEETTMHINWTLSQIDEDAHFSVFRRSAPEWIYTEIFDAEILRESLSFSFTDYNCSCGATYQYLVKMDIKGEQSIVLFETESIMIPELPAVLFPCYPNPFNPQTIIGFYLPEEKMVSLAIYNIAGELVTKLVNSRRMSGYHKFIWDGCDNKGMAASSGVYLARFQAGKLIKAKKLVLIK
jgi:hypothetical protein